MIKLNPGQVAWFLNLPYYLVKCRLIKYIQFISQRVSKFLFKYFYFLTLLSIFLILRSDILIRSYTCFTKKASSLQ